MSPAPVILQTALPADQQHPAPLPGIKPCMPTDWLRVDEAYGPQMAYRAALIAQEPKAVLHEPPATAQITAELWSEVQALLPGLGFQMTGDQITCPDGRRVTYNPDAPLWTLGHLLQEDLCILEKQGDAHVLTAAVVCFPANWRLSDKINRPLIGIHAPVPEYDSNLAARVQRLFDGVQVGRPLWRCNRLSYADADLHQPRKRAVSADMPFIRSERQCILRLPISRAVVFTIHSYVVRADDLHGTRSAAT